MLVSAHDAKQMEELAQEYRDAGREVQTDPQTNTLKVLAYPSSARRKSHRPLRPQRSEWERDFAEHS